MRRGRRPRPGFSASLHGVNWRFLREDGGSSRTLPGVTRSVPLPVMRHGSSTNEHGVVSMLESLDELSRLVDHGVDAGLPPPVLQFLNAKEGKGRSLFREVVGGNTNGEEKHDIDSDSDDDYEEGANEMDHEGEALEEGESLVPSLLSNSLMAGAISHETKQPEQPESPQVDPLKLRETEARSPSPIIIWRPSARVKLAEDVPPDLLRGLYSDDGYSDSDEASSVCSYGTRGNVEHVASFSTDMSRGDHLDRASARPPPRAHKHIPLPESSFTYRPHVPRPRPKFGAWYIPPSKWRVEESGVGVGKHGRGGAGSDSGSAAAASDDRGAPNEAGSGRPVDDEVTKQALSELDTKAAMLEEKIPKLFITKHYKRFIGEHGYRVPKYLSGGGV